MEVEALFNRYMAERDDEEKNRAEQAKHDMDVSLSQDREDIHRKYEDVKQRWRYCNGGVAPIPGRFVEYDLVFGIGSTCYVSHLLDFHDLRLFSSPFEWSGGIYPVDFFTKPGVSRNTRFAEKIDALCSRFENYLNPEDLVLYSAKTTGLEHHKVANMRTNIHFLHLFPVGESVENAMPFVIEKMSRRIDNMMANMDRAGRIMVCWAHRLWDQIDWNDAPVTDDEIISAYKKLAEIYPDKTIDFVFFEHDGAKKEYEYDKICVCEGAYRIRSNHFLTTDAYNYIKPRPQNRGALLCVDEMLDNIKLTGVLNAGDGGI